MNITDEVTDSGFRFKGELGKSEWIDGKKIDVLALQDKSSYRGATVFRNGALTIREALNTVAHEIWHLEPSNMKQWNTAIRLERFGDSNWSQIANAAESAAVHKANQVVARYDALLAKGLK